MAELLHRQRFASQTQTKKTPISFQKEKNEKKTMKIYKILKGVQFILVHLSFTVDCPAYLPLTLKETKDKRESS